jgi:glycosyltransferase involved in cell wall biosynthesis
MRVLILLAKHKDESTVAAALRGEIPRPEYLVLQEAIGADLIDFSDVEASTHPLVRLARRKSLWTGLAMLGFVKRGMYEHFYCTGEDVGIPFALMMLGAGQLRRITIVIHNGGARLRRFVLRALPSAVWKHVICLSDEQQRVLLQVVRLPDDVVKRFPQWIDSKFYDPARSVPLHSGRSDYVVACGRESRDYPLLERAATGLAIPFHVVASGWAPHAGFAAAEGIQTGGNITVESGGLSYVELRNRYGNARLVLVPVKHVTYAAGVTSICEGMSMGKAIVATTSPGTRDYVDEGVTGAVVETGDAPALRAAVERLYADRASCELIGARNRKFAVEELDVERYGARVAALLGKTPIRGSFASCYDRSA